jgi:hypothetical protein
MMNPLASKAYKEDWKAGLAGADRNFDNPYEDKAVEDNYRRGMGGSVHGILDTSLISIGIRDATTRSLQ